MFANFKYIAVYVCECFDCVCIDQAMYDERGCICKFSEAYIYFIVMDLE